MSAAKRGLTLIEVVVVVVIIGVLAALLIPAVQYARESARRSMCANNLRQLGLAVASYTADRGCMPLGHREDGFSWLCTILPALEQSNVYNSLNFSHPGIGPSPENSTSFNANIRVFICPSESTPAANYSSYAGNWGSGVLKYGYNGAFPSPGRDTYIPLSGFKDGLSNTALASEWLTGPPADGFRDRVRTVFQTENGYLEPSEFDAFCAACMSIQPSTATVGAPSVKGQNWLVGDFAWSMYAHTFTPNEPSCTNQSAFQIGAWTVSSGNNHGVNVLFCDGHVKFVEDTINLKAWRAVGSRSGGEIFSDSDF